MAATHIADCHLVDQVRAVESLLITDLVAALRHLERIAESAGTPDQEAARYDDRFVNAELFSQWVTGNADRIREVLNQITAPYTAA